jgi:diguanylate cyclase (GGDEF)-like protein/PAS domain S-box-containing protein
MMTPCGHRGVPGARCDALRFQSALLEAQAEASVDGILVVSAEGEMISFNRRFFELWGIPPEVAESRRDADALSVVRDAVEDSAEFSARVEHLYAHPLETSHEEIRLRDGRIFDRYSAPVLGDDDTLYGRVWFFRDVTAQHAEEAERLQALVQNSSDVTLVVDDNGIINYQSPATERLLGYAHDSLVGRSILSITHADNLHVARSIGRQLARTSGATMSTQLRLRSFSGAWHEFDVYATNLLDRPAVNGIVMNCHDVTQRAALERQLRELAFHDPLTNLPNRVLFATRLENAVANANRVTAVLFIDVDNFKLVNDSLGHETGDQLLVAVANRLRTCVRATDTVARFGGDEFTVLLEDLLDPDDATRTAERVGAALRAPVIVNGYEVFVSASVGVALSTPLRTQPDRLLRDADLALYRAKNAGKSCYAVFEPSMEHNVRERLELETGLRQALERDELYVVYQPVLDLESGRFIEVEALLRWQHPQRGSLSPALFIPLAEETGLIVSIGQWVLETACRQVRAWQIGHPEYAGLSVAVNLSARQFQHPGLANDIRKALADADLDPQCLRLEITESILMHDANAAVQTLRALKELGVRIAIDDFGTGYSSLAYLKQFPVDTLKIDRSFVDGLGWDPQDEAIVRSVVALAKELSLKVTGEGIETAAQQASLRAIGCDRGQGFLYAVPLNVDALGALLGEPPRDFPIAA